MCNRIEGDFRQHGEDADKHDRDYQQTYIPIADMSKLMPDYCFQFLVIQLLDDASWKSNSVCAVIDTACKCIQREFGIRIA